jgi:hypothetical protein
MASTKTFYRRSWRCVSGALFGRDGYQTTPMKAPNSYLALSKLAASSVLEIRTFDVDAYFSVPVLLIDVTTLACMDPARRAARMDPMASLREE